MSFFMSKEWWEPEWLIEPAHRNRQHLKKACVKMWNTAASPGADTEAHHHVAELRDRRVGEHLLDVVLHEGQQRGDEIGDATDQRDERLTALPMLKPS